MSTAREPQISILLRTAPADSPAWHAAFRAALPEARIAVWPDVPFAPDYVAAWHPSPELFAHVPAPKAIFNLGAGVDALLHLPDLPHVPVIRLEDAGMALPMAEYVTLAALAAYRHRDAYRAQQSVARWHVLPPEARDAFTVGILGMGVLGRACAQALRPFGFPLLGWSRTRKDIPGVESHAGMDRLGAMLARTRMLVCLVPLTAATHGLLDTERLGTLPRGAHLVNVARGALVVDADLLRLLDAGHIASATLDVFHDEPLPPEHPFWHHPRVTVTPHVSALTDVPASVAQIAAKIRQLERGESVTGIVDRTRGY